MEFRQLQLNQLWGYPSTVFESAKNIVPYRTANINPLVYNIIDECLWKYEETHKRNREQDDEYVERGQLLSEGRSSGSHVLAP